MLQYETKGPTQKMHLAAGAQTLRRLTYEYVCLVFLLQKFITYEGRGSINFQVLSNVLVPMETYADDVV
jgi:hypothetical protein